MKKILLTITSFGLVFFLAACGQGQNTEQTTPIDGSTGSLPQEEADTDEQEEVTEPEEEQESDADEADQAATEGTEDDDVAMVNGVVLYFADYDLMGTYRVETDLNVTADEAGAKQAYELWLAGPTHEDLVSLLPAATKVQSVEFKDGVAYVSFSSDILEANLGSTGELMVTEQIALIAEQFGYSRTQILVDGQVPESFLGHMDVSEPIEAEDPEQIDEME